MNATPDILILGNPNSGKTLLFNRLTGLKQKVANFPGVTVEILQGEADGLRYQDFPGIYSLDPLTKDEQVAVEGFRTSLRESRTRAVVCVLDATRLERSLYLLLQLKPLAQAAACPLVVVVNVIDEVVSKGSKVDVAGLADALGLPVLALSAKRGSGLDELRSLLAALPAREQPPYPVETEPAAVSVAPAKDEARRLAAAHGPRADVLLKSQNRIDAFLLSSWLGPVVFAVLMLLIFQSIFTWASPLMDAVETFIGWMGEGVSGLAARLPGPAGVVFSDFLRDAVFGGFGSFLVFVPQIFVLFLFIGALEDSGYLARAAVLLHRPLSVFGLSGRSFLPLLSGHACAIPAIMATRTIESPRRRLLTILAVPFMSCSARLPVYALFIGGFVPATSWLGGLVGAQGLALFLLFALGIVTGLLVSAFLDRATRGRASLGGDAPFLVELPPYRWPAPKPIALNALTRSWSFVTNAGLPIFLVTLVVWILGYFPRGAGHLDESWLGWMGHRIEPFFAPMGMDWKIGVGILTSFLAREVFVGTMGTLYGIEAAEDDLGSLSERLQAGGMGLPTAAALLVFYSLAMQCVSTLAVIRKETGSSRIPVYVFLGMSALAYAAAALTFLLFRSFQVP